MTPVQRLTGDLMRSSEIGHRKKLGTVMHRSSLPICRLDAQERRERERLELGKGAEPRDGGEAEAVESGLKLGKGG